MDPNAYLEAIVRESEALASAAEGRLDAAVPSCPGWAVRDLLLHISDVQRFWGQIVARRSQDQEGIEKERPPDGTDLTAWFRASTRALVTALQGTHPNRRVWTWAPEKNVRFVLRRQAHEAAIHRADAELASGALQPIEPKLAADGVHEFLQYMATDPAPPEDIRGRRVRLSSTDGLGEWLIWVTATGVMVERGPGDAHAVVETTASNLDLLLWRRIPLDGLRIKGDAGLVDRFVAWPDLS